MRHGLAVLALAICANVAGAAVGGCALLGQADQVNDPHDDVNLAACRTKARTQFTFDQDAGGAWQTYYACTQDGGYR